MKKILLVEDDQAIAQLVQDTLNSHQFATEHAADGSLGLSLATKENFDLIVLDVVLPNMDGFEICRRLRDSGCKTPILMLTSQSEVGDKVQGLESGADDYVTKPFEGEEFVARIRALLRRVASYEAKGKEQLVFGELSLDLLRRQVSRSGKRIDLTTREFDVLAFLGMNAGKAFSREELMKEIWGISAMGFEPTVTTHLSRLRSKLEQDQRNPRFILTVHGVGYRFAKPDEL